MKLVVLKDGTVPVAVAKVLFEDGLDARYSEDLANSDAHSYAEVFDIANGDRIVTHIGITWADGEGFHLLAFGTYGEANGWFTEVADGEPIIRVDAGHKAVTVDPGDDEWYAHIFTL